MSENIPLKVEFDISELVDGLDLGENGFEELEQASQKASQEIANNLNEAAESTENVAETADKAESSWSDFGDTMNRMPGPLGMISRGIGSLGRGFSAARGYIVASTASLHAFRAALMATGIGAIIVAVGTLIGLLSRLQPVIDMAERAFSILGTTLDHAATRLGALLGLNEDVNQSLRDTIAENDRLIRQKQQLRDIEIELITEYAKLEKAIREQQAAVRDEALTLEQRMDALARLEELQEELIQTELTMAKNRRDNAEQSAALAENDREAQEELQEARAEVTRVEARAFQMQQTNMRIRNRLRREAEREERQAEEERIKRYEAEAERNRQRVLSLEAWRREINKMYDAEQELAHAIEVLNESLGDSFDFDEQAPLGSIAFVEDQIRATNERIRQATTDSERQRLAEQLEIYQQQLEAYQGMADGIEQATFQISDASIAADLRRAQSAEQASAAIVSQLIREIMVYAIRNAFASAGPAAPLVAGVFMGAAQSLIDSALAFAEGGSFMTSGPTPILVGDNPGGIERVDITPISSPNISGPQGDFHSALDNVEWVASMEVTGSDMVFFIRKQLKDERELGGSGTL